ncbi:hypothetical protein HDU67_008860 [Dinochytrium kinnereticum]|nr:hypothetical protein HDU67_008860 [Dinochytrium kinnereticum]
MHHLKWQGRHLKYLVIALAIWVEISDCKGTTGSNQQPLLAAASDPEWRFARKIEDCPRLKRRPKPPSSVHDLRVDEINVVAALGDSITAAFGAKGLPKKGEVLEKQNTDENRGLSFIMGGDAGYDTVANFVRHFNPYAFGASFGDHLAEFCLMFSDLLTLSTLQLSDYVVHRMASSPEVDFENDFKLLHIFIGNNDVCAGCSSIANRTFLSPDNYEYSIRTVLDDIKRRIPKVIVNVLMQFNVSKVWDLTNKDPWCNMVRSSGLVYECSCAFLPGDGGNIMRSRMDSLVQEYNKRLEKIRLDYNASPHSIKSSHYLNSLNEENAFGYLRTPDPSFAVMVDPLFSGVQLENWNISFLSDIDCFHPSSISHRLMGIGVWNNLFLPYKHKSRSLLPSSTTTSPIDASLADDKQLVRCPDEASRIKTS